MGIIRKTLTANNLKIIAAGIMFFDHFVSVFIPHNELLSLIFRLFGRAAAPVFCYFIAEGYHYTSNIKKYIGRLLVLAVVSHLPYILSFGYTMFQATSVVWPLALGLIALAVCKNGRINVIIKLAVVLVCCAVSYTANWFFVAVLWILVFAMFHGNFKRQIAGFCVVGAAIYMPMILRNYGFFHERFPQWFQFGIFLAVPLLAMYNGKSGSKTRFMSWFFYVFYPAHLILLYLLKKFTALSEVLGSRL